MPNLAGFLPIPLRLLAVATRNALDDSLDVSSGGGRLAPEALVGVVATALAEALRLAAEAERWEIVAQLAAELAARRQARSEQQADNLGPERLAKRGGTR